MLINDELKGQDNPPVEEDQDGDQPDNDDDGGQKPAEGEGETPNTVKIGDKEYTPEQIAEMEKKASGYDALLPDYTKKSQRLSELENPKDSKPQEEDLPSYKKKEWEPKSIDELKQALQEAEERGMARALGTLEEREKAQAKAKQEVDDFVGEVKKTDKDFDDKDFFSYAAKHRFPIATVDDLKAVYSSYAELQQTAEKSKEEGRKGKESRKDKVNNPSGGNNSSQDFTDIRVSSGSILDAAMSAFERFKK